MNLSELIGLQWHWQGPREVQESGADPYFELRIRELPDFFVAGATRDEVLAASGPALHAFLKSYVDHGEDPPLPDDRSPGWILRTVQMPALKAFPVARTSNEPILTH